MSLGIAKILLALAIAFFGIAKANAGDRNESKSSKIAVIRQVVRTEVLGFLSGLHSSLPTHFIMVVLGEII